MMLRTWVVVVMSMFWCSVALAQVPQFREFPAQVYTGPNAPVRLVTPSDKMFRTRLRDGAKQPVNFAGHYIVTTWGCGTSCESGSVIDALSGQIIDLPGSICCEPTENVDDNFERIIARKDSRLIVLSGLINENGAQGAHFYVLEGGRFVHLADVPFQAKGSPPPTAIAPVPPSVARSAGESQPGAANRTAIDDLSSCFAREYSPSRYSSLDGGQSSIKLLMQCADQWDAASKQCRLAGNGSEGDCNVKTGMLAQVFLKLKEAGAR